MKKTKEQLIESGLRKIYNKVLTEDRDTSWAIRQIEEFIAKNETRDQDKEFGGSISMKLNGAVPSKNFNITFDELRLFVKALRRQGQ